MPASDKRDQGRVSALKVFLRRRPSAAATRKAACPWRSRQLQAVACGAPSQDAHYLSTPPMIGSRLAMMAIVSAIRLPGSSCADGLAG